MEERLIACREQLENVNVQLANAKQEVEKPFPQEDELKTKSARLDELNILLNMDKRESEIVEGEPSEEAPDRDGAAVWVSVPFRVIRNSLVKLSKDSSIAKPRYWPRGTGSGLVIALQAARMALPAAFLSV